MDELRGSSDQNALLKEIIQKTISNKIVDSHIEEAAGNFMQDRSENNLEIRQWLKKYAEKMCEICIQNLDHVHKPDQRLSLRKDIFQDECGSIVSVERLKENMLIYAQQIKKDLKEKIVLSDEEDIQYFLAKIFGTLTQMFFANYYDFDYKLLLMTREESYKSMLEEQSGKRKKVIGVSDDIIENQKRIEQAVKEIRETLNDDEIRKN